MRAQQRKIVVELRTEGVRHAGLQFADFDKAVQARGLRDAGERRRGILAPPLCTIDDHAASGSLVEGA